MGYGFSVKESENDQKIKRNIDENENYVLHGRIKNDNQEIVLNNIDNNNTQNFLLKNNNNIKEKKKKRKKINH